MIKTLKVILQIVSIFIPIFNFIFNVETVLPMDAILQILVGVIIAILIEWAWHLFK